MISLKTAVVNKITVFILICIISPAAIFSQEAALQSNLQNFSGVDLLAKAGILEDTKSVNLTEMDSTLLISDLNDYLLSESFLFRSGVSVDFQVISACIAAIAELGDSSSFPALFSVLTSGYPEVISLEAAGALDLIAGDYRLFLIDVILRNPPGEKLAAFRAGMNSQRFSSAEKGQLAQLALEQSLASVSTDETSFLSTLRYSSILTVTRLQWTYASEMAIRHFYRTLADFQYGAASRDRFLEAIVCLGEIGSSDAVLALALQLGLFNAQTEKTRLFDEDIILALVMALGRIGDKAAFDYLYYISFLNYTDNIQAAAKEALARLKW